MVLLSKAPVLAYYYPKEQLVLQCDASNKGLGASLFQNGKPITYRSRSLTETESRYAVVEKEMLAVVWGLEKFHYYTYGRPVIVHSDHKPLVHCQIAIDQNTQQKTAEHGNEGEEL